MSITFDLDGRNTDSLKEDFAREAREQGMSEEQIQEIINAEDWLRRIREVSY